MPRAGRRAVARPSQPHACRVPPARAQQNHPTATIIPSDQGFRIPTPKRPRGPSGVHRSPTSIGTQHSVWGATALPGGIILFTGTNGSARRMPRPPVNMQGENSPKPTSTQPGAPRPAPRRPLRSPPCTPAGQRPDPALPQRSRTPPTRPPSSFPQSPPQLLHFPTPSRPTGTSPGGHRGCPPPRNPKSSHEGASLSLLGWAFPSRSQSMTSPIPGPGRGAPSDPHPCMGSQPRLPQPGGVMLCYRAGSQRGLLSPAFPPSS